MEQTAANEWNKYEKKWEWRDFYFHKVLRRHIFEKYFHYDIAMPYYAHQWVMGMKRTNDWIAEKIESGEPFMVARFGNTELQTVIRVLKERIQGKSTENDEEFHKWFGRLGEWSGFFPQDEKLAEKFTDVLLESCQQTDLLAMWHCHMEDYIIDKYMDNTKLTYLTRIEPWRASNPWSAALKGKKVLVIHPFEDSIRNQYEKREMLFENKNVLPEFKLKTLKAVQTIAGEKDERFETWFDALEYMYSEALKIDFDVAIIGCGAYGMPLAAKLKAAGKQTIHMGGVSQMLFGIKGKRWVESPMNKLKFNDAWVYPLDSEIPSSYSKVEGGCYWK